MIETAIHTTSSFHERLAAHPLPRSITSLKSLQVFMEHHVYSVWDFMNIVKALQRALAPTTHPWMPPQNPEMTRFINEVVLVEESDEHPKGGHASHFQMYCDAMLEIGASPQKVQTFLKDQNMKAVPQATQGFLQFTQSILAKQNMHEIAAMFCFAREQLIPKIFKSFLEQSPLIKKDAPIFFHYVHRHIEIDGDEHGHMAEDILKHFCGQDLQKWQEATEVAVNALKARQQLWNGILEYLH